METTSSTPQVRMGTDSGQITNQSWSPVLSLYQDAENYYCDVELPGVQPDEMQLAINNGELVIVGLRPALTDEVSYLLLERKFGPFRRRVSIPPGVDLDRIQSSFEAGLLHITLPKATDEHSVLLHSGKTESDYWMS